MHIFTILVPFGILYQQSIGELHCNEHEFCHCQGNHNIQARSKRQIFTNLQPNLPGTPISNINEKSVPPNQWNHEGNDKESEIVGLGGLLHLRALTAQAKARAAVARVRARARLHRPLLLEPTPQEFLNDDDSQNNFAGPVLSLNHQNNPTPHPLQLDLGINPNDHSLPTTTIPIETQNNPNSARSAEGYENNPYQPQSYDEEPEVRIHNIDNSEEVYQNRKPGFSIIPVDWKPPPDSNLYAQGDYKESYGPEPILAVLPGKWTDDNDYETEYYDDYDVIPIAYNIPDEAAPSYYQRSAEPEDEIPKEFPESFLGLKQHLQNWEENPMIWRPDSNKQRSANPSDKRHFHHGHSHAFTHKHFNPGHSSGFHQSTSFVKPAPSHHGFSDDHTPVHPSAFAHGHKSGFSHQLSHGHSITINNQKTIVVAPPGSHKNVEIAQVAGNNNAASQSQASSQAHGGFASEHSNFQAAQVIGNHNSASQSQTSSQVHHGFNHGGFAPEHSNFQAGHGIGKHNAASQSHTSSQVHHGFNHGGFGPEHSNFQEGHGIGKHNGESQSQGFNPAHQDFDVRGLAPEHSDFQAAHGIGNHNAPSQAHHGFDHGGFVTELSSFEPVPNPAASHQGSSNFQSAQISGTHNAASQSQAHQGFSHGGFAPTHSNFQSAQVTGTNNAASQSQGHKGFSHGGFAPGQSNFQSAQVSGSGNSVSQSQTGEAPFVGEPYLIDVPRRSQSFWRAHGDFPQTYRRKRSIDDNALSNDFKPSKSSTILNILKKQNQLLKKIQETAKYDKEMLFITEMGSNLIDNFEESLHAITKRTVPILRLIVDPNAKLDVPKTLENMGTVARNSFENKRAPMYHIKNFAGSAKDAFLSTLRMVPQDFLVPSRYKIIDREREGAELAKIRADEVRESAPSLAPRARTLRERIKERRNPQKEIPVRQPERPREPEDNFSDTYRKIGSMFKESIRSGQDTLNHVGELYHSTRKALATARLSAPRVLLSSMRIPAVERHQPLLPHNDKVLMIAPKILQLKQESVGAPHYSDEMDDLVGIGNVMDSLGISNPDAGEVGQRRIVIQPVTVPKREPNPIIPNLQSRSNFGEIQQPEGLKRFFLLADALQNPEDSVENTMDELDNAREAVGASSLKDFVLQMKDGFSNLFKDKLEEARNKLSERLNYDQVKGKVSVEATGKEPRKFKFKAPNPMKLLKASNRVVEDTSKNETVGAGLLLPKRLLTPFMGQPSRTERRQYFQELGDSEELSEEKEEQAEHNREVIGGINPIIFNNTFDLCDDKNPFEILATWNSSKHANCTKKSQTSNVESATTISIDSSTQRSDGEESTTIPPEVTRGLHEEKTITVNIDSTEDVGETTTKVTDHTDAKKKTNHNHPTDDIGVGMKIAKKLLTPFMGKPYEKEVYSYFAPYGDNYEEDSYEDGYLGIENPEQLQALPNEETGKKNLPRTKLKSKQRNKFTDPLDLNHL